MESLIVGNSYCGKVTKQLLHRVPPHSIIIVEHEDIDLVAAEDMVRKKVKAVINTKVSMSGNVPRTGMMHLQENDIPVFDISLTMEELEDDYNYIKIENNKLFKKRNSTWTLLGTVTLYDHERITSKQQQGKYQFQNLFRKFAMNSLDFASFEIESFIDAVQSLPKLTDIEGKLVFLVARGGGVQEDLRMIRPFIKHNECIVIAVDGASGVLYEHQIKPNYIVGDMDSISSDANRYTSTFIAHSYMDGKSPGKSRLEQLSVECTSIPFPGISEDLALMLAYVSDALHIYTLGCRNSFVELIEKGRKGMGSTLLTRMYAGEKISDIKGINQWLCFQSGYPFPETSFIKDYFNVTKEY
ncbi:putative cytokinetic ring protein SteA [Evansella sp. AB-rgal1]|uniref:putative cytokinetic ring protein SteA n=1 Tax=Evansella sp. AB-rgal1 TaxID=3242696 RepID=UPI00359EDDBB